MSQMEAEAKGHYELLDKKAQGLGALVAVRPLLPTTGPCGAQRVCVSVRRVAVGRMRHSSC